MTCLVDEESLDGGEYEEDEGGDDPDLGRDKVLLSLLPPVTGSQGWYKVKLSVDTTDIQIRYGSHLSLCHKEPVKGKKCS